MSKRYQVRLDLSPEVGEALERLSAASGKSVPKLTASFLDEASEAFALMAEALEAAREMESVARQQYLGGFEEMAAEFKAMAKDGNHLLSAFSAAAEGGHAPRARVTSARARGVNPRGCNTGVRKS